MATGHSFSVLASHSVKQPINPKTGIAFTKYERNCNTETTGRNEKNDDRCVNGNAPVRYSAGSGAYKKAAVNFSQGTVLYINAAYSAA